MILKSILAPLCLVIPAGVFLGCDHQYDNPSPSGNEEFPFSWRVHDMERPHPEVISPLEMDLPVPRPAGAVVLFDGTDLSQWETPGGDEATWTVENGHMEVSPGGGTIQTRQGFGDVHVHVEWASPDPPTGTSQDRGNSGVFMMERYEIQVLDSYEADTYADGQAGSIYGQYPPRYNAMRPPGEWNTYDIFFRRPRFNDNGTLEEPARVTVLHNGILIQNNEKFHGPTQWLEYLPYEAHADELPIALQDHGDPVRFRNIWALPVPELSEPPEGYAAEIQPVDMSASELDRYTGVYDRSGGPIEIRRDGEGLVADLYWRPAIELIPLAETEFVLANTDGWLIFDLDEDGTPTGLTFHLGGVEMPAPKTE